MMPIKYLGFSKRTYALIYELKMIFVKFLSGHKFSINQTCLVELKWKLLRSIISKIINIISLYYLLWKTRCYLFDPGYDSYINYHL